MMNFASEALYAVLQSLITSATWGGSLCIIFWGEPEFAEENEA